MTTNIYNVAFISSALSPEHEDSCESFDFFAVLLGGIVTHAEKDLGGRVAVYVPQKTDADTTNQGYLFQKVLRLGRIFDAIVIAPFETDVIKAELDKYIKNAILTSDEVAGGEDIPLVFIDKNIEPEELGDDICRRFSVVNVACDNRDGGRKAARLLVKALDQLDSEQKRGSAPRTKRLMILKGLEGGEERAAGFAETVKLALPDALPIVPESDDLNFTRRGARRWMEDQLALIRKGKSDFGSLNDNCNWGVFACNDEMALGLHTVISTRHNLLRERVGTANNRNALDSESALDVAELIFLQGIRIVGFDGIGAAREVIAPMKGVRDRWFVGTIGAEVERQSETAIDWIKRLRDTPDLKNNKPKSILKIKEISG